VLFKGVRRMDESGNLGSRFMIFILFVILEGLFYGFGTAVQMVNRKDLEKEISENNRKALLLERLKDQPNSLICTIQVLTTLISMTIGGFQIPIFGHRLASLLSRIPLIQTVGESVLYRGTEVIVLIIFIIIIVAFGILIPKKIAGNRSTKWAYQLVYIVYLITVVFQPFTYIINVIANTILRIFNINPREGLEDVTEEEIISIVNEGHEQGILLESEAEMIHNIMEFSDTQADDIMTHRKNIVGLEAHLTLEKAMEFVLDSIYSRFPVYDDNIDNIIGIIYLKDLMSAYMNTDNKELKIKNIKGLVRHIIFIPESRKIDLLFQLMRTQKVQMIVAIDEYGQTSGIISMEDIVEEIVGNIFDEYDEDNNFIIPIGEERFIMHGLTPIDEVEDVLKIKIEDEDFGTLNGYLISQLDRIPSEDEHCVIRGEGYLFKILSVKNNCIQKVRVEKVSKK
jgi:putative hemolysin